MRRRTAALVLGAAIGCVLWAAVAAQTAHAEAWDVRPYLPILLVAGVVVGLLVRAPIWIAYVGCVLGQLIWMVATSQRGPWAWWFSGLWLLLYTLPFALGAWFARRTRAELAAMRRR